MIGSQARSSTEAEYRAIEDTTAKIVRPRPLLYEIGFTQLGVSRLWCDNIGAIYLTANPIFHCRIKHVEIDLHFVREMVQAGHLDIQHLSSEYQVADAFTKPLQISLFLSLCDKLPLSGNPSSA